MKRSNVVAKVLGMVLVVVVSSGFTATPALAPQSDTLSAVEVVSVSGGTLASV